MKIGTDVGHKNFSRSCGACQFAIQIPQLKLRAIFGCPCGTGNVAPSDGEYIKLFLAEARGKQKQEAVEIKAC
jgi:hypothetical protein